LDLSLPKKDGLEILKDLRSRSNNIPVIILTARDTITDKITGLDSGADDYLVKPFEIIMNYSIHRRLLMLLLIAICGVYIFINNMK
jgi:CheY-like chemotaxis protein